jgi:hypothetical protein
MSKMAILGLLTMPSAPPHDEEVEDLLYELHYARTELLAYPRGSESGLFGLGTGYVFEQRGTLTAQS